MIFLITYLILINTTSYLVMVYDKWQAKRKQQRVSENNLFALAFVLGAIGIYLAMKAPLYHKAAKQKFKVGIPALILINGISIYFLYMNINR